MHKGGGTVGHEKIEEHAIEKIAGHIDITASPVSGSILDIGGGGEGIIGQQYGKSVIAIDMSKEELEEAPKGAIKLVMDARNMTFLHNMFEAATLFFTLMYMTQEDVVRTLSECKRVLVPGGTLVIWDMEIPKNTTSDKQYYAIYLDVTIDGRTVSTGYGTRWDNTQSKDDIAAAAKRCGFSIKEKSTTGNTFVITCTA